MEDTLSVKFFDFSKYHGKHPDAGSTVIRVNQLLRYWPNAGKYLYGQRPDVLIFQKVYVGPDYRFPAHFRGIKILDICDSDWLAGSNVVETIGCMDAVTCPTEALATFFRQVTDKPVVIIPDRFDPADFPVPRQHLESAKTVLWYGYRHNTETLKPALDLINRAGLKLLIIADDDPLAWQWVDRADMETFRYERYQFIKHSNDPKQLHLDMQEADFAVLPKGGRPVDVFKSDNKTIRAILCGLPVAATGDEVRELIDPAARRKYLEEHYQRVCQSHDIRESVKQYKVLINQLSKAR